MINPLAEDLQNSTEPVLRAKARQLAGGPPLTLKEAADSPIIQALLSERDGNGEISVNPYHKFCGTHWVLACLAEAGYPPGDTSLHPLMAQCYAWILPDGQPMQLKPVNGRVRRCASQEGNVLWYSLKLGLADERSEILADSLVRWQWPDGGWNCDRKPEAVNSSYWESLVPCRALALYALTTGSASARQAVEQAAELFLKRRLIFRLRDGQPMHTDFLQLHYPSFWSYDILSALKVMKETGHLGDPRCTAVLDLLAQKQLPGGGFPLEKAMWHNRTKKRSRLSNANWGPVGAAHSNPFVTLDAWAVLQAAGKLP